MWIEKYKIVWFNVKHIVALNCVQYCGKDTLVLPVTPELCTVFSIEVAPYQRLPSWQQRFQSWLEAEWEILQILLNLGDEFECADLILTMWQFPMELVAESTCIPEGLKWIVCRERRRFLLYLSVLVNVITPDLNKDMTKPTFLQVTPTAWLNAKILLDHHTFWQTIAWCISSFSVQTHLIWSDTMGTWGKCRDVLNTMGVTI